jgi:hypothetical protein
LAQSLSVPATKAAVLVAGGGADAAPLAAKLPGVARYLTLPKVLRAMTIRWIWLVPS